MPRKGVSFLAWLVVKKRNDVDNNMDVNKDVNKSFTFLFI